MPLGFIEGKVYAEGKGSAALHVSLLWLKVVLHQSCSGKIARARPPLFFNLIYRNKTRYKI